MLMTWKRLVLPAALILLAGAAVAEPNSLKGAVKDAAKAAAKDPKAAVAEAASAVKLETEDQKVSYAIGAQVGESLRSAKVPVDRAAFTAALFAALEGKDLAMTKEELNQTMNAFQQRMMEAHSKAQQEEGSKGLEEAKKFLEENKAKEGVKTLPSGLQYKVLKSGTGASPKASDTVKTHYEGKFINGEIFDSSIQRGTPAEFPVGGVIKGWTEALQLMKVGDKWQLFVPPDLAYGENSPPSIPPNSLLIFEVELIDIVKQ